MAADPVAAIPFVEARHYTRTAGRSIDLIVVHTMESPEKPTTAEDVAQWFAGPTAPQASCHYCIDADSIVQCVLERNVAWAAPGANHNGIQFEHAGYARQTPGDWADAYSQQMLRRSAALAAAVCRRYAIPPTYVNAVGLQRGLRGVTTHAQATLAFPGPGRTHTDPGPGFPMAHYLAWVREAMGPDEPVWFTRAKTLPPMWAWFAWKDNGAPPAWRPPQVPRKVPAWWWPRYAIHRGQRT